MARHLCLTERRARTSPQVNFRRQTHTSHRRWDRQRMKTMGPNPPGLALLAHPVVRDAGAQQCMRLEPLRLLGLRCD